MLGDLRRYPIGVIESAVAKLGRRPRGEGVTAPGLSVLRATHARLLGYAIPVQMSIDAGDPHGRRDNDDWWRHIEQQSASQRVVVARISVPTLVVESCADGCPLISTRLSDVWVL